MNDPDLTVMEAGEAIVLDRILRLLPPSQALLGPGDDAAVLAAPDGRMVASVDTLVHGPDFRLAWSSGFDLGWKAAAVNLADIAAMGARPTALLVALTLPENTRVRFVEELADGLHAACEQLAPGCAVEGGDLAVSATLTIAVTALGVLDGHAPITRSGARPGDVLAVVGTLGAAGRGLSLLFQHGTAADSEAVPIDLGAFTAQQREDLAAQLRPRPPVAAGREAARSGATAMMDVSDGLVLDTSRLAVASAVTIDIHTVGLGPDPVSALGGGEDHALLVTFPADMPLPGSFRVIGRVLPAADSPVLVDGCTPRGPGGWDPYRDGRAAAVSDETTTACSRRSGGNGRG